MWPPGPPLSQAPLTRGLPDWRLNWPQARLYCALGVSGGLAWLCRPPGSRFLPSLLAIPTPHPRVGFGDSDSVREQMAVWVFYHLETDRHHCQCQATGCSWGRVRAPGLVLEAPSPAVTSASWVQWASQVAADALPAAALQVVLVSWSRRESEPPGVTW